MAFTFYFDGYKEYARVHRLEFTQVLSIIEGSNGGTFDKLKLDELMRPN